jgi:transcriptional regulator with XRE-family HTH domain
VERREYMERLKHIRAERGLTLRDLAQESGVSKDTISEIERGVRKPHPTTLGKLAKALDVEVADLFPKKAQAPLSREWAFSTSDEVFRRDVQSAPTERLWGLVTELVADEQLRLFEDERIEKPPADVLYKRSVLFARALIVREELLRRGEDPPENRVLALKRYVNALELTEDPALGQYRAEEIFSPEQVAAFLAENERDNERIRQEMQNLDAADVEALMLASPVLRKLSEAFRKNQERRGHEQPEAC